MALKYISSKYKYVSFSASKLSKCFSFNVIIFGKILIVSVIVDNFQD